MAEVAPPPRVRLEMRGIRKRFGATVALDGVDLAVAAGEICGLVGENGAGKSTLMAILAGAVQPDEGTMAIDGQRLRAARPDRGAPRRRRDDLSGAVARAASHASTENILLGVEPTRFGVLQRGEHGDDCDAGRSTELGHGDIAPHSTVVGDLAMPVQQIVEIARAIAVGCRVLVLDEPTSSLGREDARRCSRCSARLRSQGHAIVYISHFLEEVTEAADRFVVLRDGRNAGGGADGRRDTRQIVAMMIGGSARETVPARPARGGRGDPVRRCAPAG